MCTFDICYIINQILKSKTTQIKRGDFLVVNKMFLKVRTARGILNGDLNSHIQPSFNA